MAPITSRQTKKQGAPKAKGGVRAKSGCYTCRIRRKKCDERPNAEGQCETCIRLRLQCLGFGTKRPEWLRDNNKVVELRDKIKTFLASNGMIKGHSAANSRNNDHDQMILHLSDSDYTSSSSDSPASQILSLSSNDDTITTYRTTPNTSSLRDYREQSWPDEYNPQQPPHPLLLARSVSRTLYPTAYSRQESPYGSNGYNDYNYTNTNNSTSIVSWPQSSFGSSYNINLNVFEEEDLHYYPAPEHTIPQPLPHDDLLDHYMKTVAGLQYLLADRTVFSIVIFDGVTTQTFTREAARLLSSIHRRRLHSPRQSALEYAPDERKRYEELNSLLKHHPINDDAAMASLHVISSFLFDGGKGEWEKWLRVAYQYCRNVFNKGNGVVQTLLDYSNEPERVRERFLIKTTVWFDILASITTMQDPLLLETVRDFCSPTLSYISDPNEDRLSMISFMGCENIVVWAIAETSHLATWKKSQEERGCLSVPELVQRGAEIEQHLEGPIPPCPLFLNDLEQERKYTSDIFRSAAKVYLRTVVSGDYPYVRDIDQAVGDTLAHYERLTSAQESVRMAVIRSSVFALYICGCMTDNQCHRNTVMDQLNSQDGPGNCSVVRDLLHEIWSNRLPSNRKDPVNWRQRLKKEQLLLV